MKRLCKYFIGCCLLLACRGQTNLAPVIAQKDLWVDTSVIPPDTVLCTHLQATGAGIYYHKGQPFSGHMLTMFANRGDRVYTSFYKGMMHGIYRSFYSNGALHEVRQYNQNFSTGRHYGFWPNGKRQFDYVYYKDRRAGYMKKWYQNGMPYMSLNYINDHEEGLQQGWRENGKPFINYIAKDGHRYGLQETMLCYKLDKKGEIIK